MEDMCLKTAAAAHELNCSWTVWTKSILPVLKQPLSPVLSLPHAHLKQHQQTADSL